MFFVAVLRPELFKSKVGRPKVVNRNRGYLVSFSFEFASKVVAIVCLRSLDGRQIVV
jgi:hypothetical protein